MRKYRISYIGRVGEVDLENDLLVRLIAKVAKKEVVVVRKEEDADLVIVYPYVVGSIGFKLRWVLNYVFHKIGVPRGNIDVFRWLVGVGKGKALFISHENLDKPYWWNMLGRFLVDSDIHRLTFWPKIVDPQGARFPYWYNYVAWPQYPRNQFYKRFGGLYDVDTLMAPLKEDANRINKAVAICSHLDHPRKALLESVRAEREVDLYGASGIAFSGSKKDVMSEYKFAFCPENSAGFGYDTEKIPEAWMAGCVPLGVFSNPYSDFDKRIAGFSSGNCSEAYRHGLLDKRPSLSEVEAYVESIL